MSVRDDNSESGTGEKKGYNFLLRFIIFAFIAGPASVFGLGHYGRAGLQNSISAAERGDYSPLVIMILWLGGLVSTALLVFKK